jgi:regulator of vacuolar morphogenesis
MSRKRRNTSSPESDYSPSPKKPRSIIPYNNPDGEDDLEDPQDVREQPRLNLDSGLHNAFPGLGEDGDELFYGPATDGIDYLRMVR